jgi:hypothetical protein
LRSTATGPDRGDHRLASGREKHTQKITVYLSAEELLDLERARLALLRYGAAADRGRIVREAIAVLLADLDAQGQNSLLARRIVSGNHDADLEHSSGQHSSGQNDPGRSGPGERQTASENSRLASGNSRMDEPAL